MRILHEVLPPGRRELVCLVGAGGKSSLLRCMAGETSRHERTLITTTTKMFRWQLESCGPLVLESDHAALLAALKGRGGSIVAAASASAGSGKVRGLTPEQLDDIHQQGLYTHILVEADGARGMDLRGPGSHEPVLPLTTTAVLAVVGLRSLGQPIDALHVHRPEAVALAARQELGSEIREETLARILETYQDVSLKAAPGAIYVPVLNQADTKEAVEIARKVATLVFHACDCALITEATSDDCVGEVWADGRKHDARPAWTGEAGRP